MSTFILRLYKNITEGLRTDKIWILKQFDTLVVFRKELFEKQNIYEKAANDNKRMKKNSMQKVMLADKQNLSYLSQTPLHH